MFSLSRDSPSAGLLLGYDARQVSWFTFSPKCSAALILRFNFTLADMPKFSFEQLMVPRDEYGRLMDGSLHDGYTTGVFVNRTKRTATLCFKDLKGFPINLKMEGVQMFSLQDFYEGNIILDLWSWPLSEMPQEYWKLLFRSRVDESDLTRMRLRILGNAPHAHGVALSSSYGCEFAAICETFSISGSTVMPGS